MRILKEGISYLEPIEGKVENQILKQLLKSELQLQVKTICQCTPCFVHVSTFMFYGTSCSKHLLLTVFSINQSTSMCACTKMCRFIQLQDTCTIVLIAQVKHQSQFREAFNLLVKSDLGALTCCEIQFPMATSPYMHMS